MDQLSLQFLDNLQLPLCEDFMFWIDDDRNQLIHNENNYLMWIQCLHWMKVQF